MNFDFISHFKSDMECQSNISNTIKTWNNIFQYLKTNDILFSDNVVHFFLFNRNIWNLNFAIQDDHFSWSVTHYPIKQIPYITINVLN